MNSMVPCVFSTSCQMHISTTKLTFLPVFTDKFKRTALIHAARDGSAHILSYLLARGSNANAADSSGNTVLHYAAAYGWYFCTRALLDAGAKPDEPNDWKVGFRQIPSKYQS